MASKRGLLKELAVKNARKPDPTRLVDPATEKVGFRRVTCSLYTPEADWIDALTRLLKKAGNSKANRSLIIQNAIRLLARELDGKSPEEVLRHFSESSRTRRELEMPILHNT